MSGAKDASSPSTRTEPRPEAEPDSPFERWEERRRLAADQLVVADSAELATQTEPNAAKQSFGSEEVRFEPIADDASLSLPPGPGRPAVVQTAQWVYRPTEFMEKCRSKFGPCFRVRLGPLRNVVFLSDPAYVKTVLAGDPALLHTGDINGIFRPIIGSNSILVLDGPKHMEQRRLLLPPFHGESLDGFRDAMTEVAERQIADWPNGERFSLLPRMHAISTEIVLHAILGIREPDRLERLRELLPRFLDNCQTPAFLVPFLRREIGGRSSWGRLMHSVRELDDELFEEIGLRRGEAGNGAGARPDVLSMLVRARHEDGEPISDQELRDELLTLLVAGHETTSGALALALEEIVRHPEVVARIRDEAGGEDDIYTEAVVREGLRIRPVLPIVGRKLTRPARLGAYSLPKGTVLMPCAYLLHREPAIYPKPDQFRPERFLGPAAGTYTWIPFGGGTRRCVGASFALLQMKVVVRTIFSRLQLQPAGRPEPVRRRSVSLAPARGGEVVAERRAN